MNVDGATPGESVHYQIRSLSTNRCLQGYTEPEPEPVGQSAQSTQSFKPQPQHGPSAVVLLPCDAANPDQVFVFGKGLHTVSSLVHVASNKSLAIANSTLHSNKCVRGVLLLHTLTTHHALGFGARPAAETTGVGACAT